MQFKHSQDINAPVDYVFKRMTDFPRFEGQTGKDRISFKRIGRAPVHIGTRWDISVPYKGRNRKFTAELSQLIAPRVVSYRSTSPKYQAALSLTFTPLGAGSCRMDMLLVAQSRSFSTGMVFKTIRLARKRINRNIRTRMEVLAQKLEDRYHNTDD